MCRKLVVRPPGIRLRRLAVLCFSRAANTVVFAPLLNELEDDYFAALLTHDAWRAQVRCLKGYGSFWLAVAALLPVSLMRLGYELWKVTKQS